MNQENKSFIQLTLVLVIIFALVQYFILLPTQRAISENRKKSQFFQDAIQELYKKDFPPEEEYLSEIQNYNEALKRRFDKMVTAVSFQPRKVEEFSKTSFREKLEETHEELANQASRVGLQLDRNLGFDQRIETISQRHYANLEMLESFLAKFIALSSELKVQPTLNSIEHLDLEGTGEQFLVAYQVALEFSAPTLFVTRLLYELSLPSNNQQHFTRVSKLQLKSSSQNNISVAITLGAISVSPNAPVAPEKEGEILREDIIQVPIWQRY